MGKHNTPLERYLRPTYWIDCDTESIKEKARDLTERNNTMSEKAKSLFYFVRDEIKYNPYPPFKNPELYRASLVLGNGEGYCVQKAVLLAALARAIGIPARLRLSDIKNHLSPPKLLEEMGTNIFVFHGYNELYVGLSWVKAVASFDLEMCNKNKIIPVEFDGRNNALFHSHNREGELHIEYLRDRGHYEDLPLGEILHSFKDYHNKDRSKQADQE
jgi:hypothetical protein